MKVRAYTSRIGQIFRLEASALRLQPAQRRASLRSLPSRWAAIMRGARRIEWLGRPYHFETRFEPVLMHVHQALVGKLIEVGALPPRPTILDVGANTGQFGTAVLVVRPRAEIDSLEPNPACRALLEENARNDAGWRVHPYGISDADGQAELWFVPGRSGQGSVYRDNAGLGMLGSAEMQVVSAQVDVVSGATLVRTLPGPFDLVKVDVEGLERVVIHEVACLSWRYLLVELGGMREGALSPEEVLQLLAQAGVDASLVRSFGDPAETHDVLLKRTH